MNDIKKEFFTSIVSKQKETTENKLIYDVLPKYGSGYFIIYEIIQGMYLTFNDIEFKNTIVNKSNRGFSSPIIKIDYSLEGSYISNCPNNRVCIVNKGSSSYYVGTDNFTDVNFKGKRYKSISIFCYLNEIINSIEQFLGISKRKIEEYYKNLYNRNNFLIIKTDTKITNMINEINDYIANDNIELIKIRTIELFLYEINNYESYKNKMRKYYTRSTVDKIEDIKVFIEDNMQEHITIDTLSKKYSISATKLKECFKSIYGMGTYTYLKQYRMKTACKLLLDSDYSILEIANYVGYSNSSKFAATFKKTFGLAPLQYKICNSNNYRNSNKMFKDLIYG